jgi:cobalt-zinc-cadmium efflux system outer membrane protein
MERPAGVTLSDGLSEDEAAALALWNNPALGATLTTLGFARAELQEAGFLKNPIFSLLFPLGPKQLEFTLNWPLDALWQRPRRVAAAQLDVERVASSLIQSGLDVVRETRIAHAEVLLAQQCLRIGQESARVRGELARIAESRLKAGDASEMETNAMRIDAARAEEDRARFAYEALLAETRLRSLIGLAEDPEPFVAGESEIPSSPAADVVGLIRQAIAARPDVRAAELTMEAAAAKAGWERSKALALTATIDANGEGKEGFEIGPGFQLEVPLFNRNQAGKARAQAEIERAAWQYVEVKRRVALEVREACLLQDHATRAVEVLRERVLPLVEQEVRRAEKIYADGQAPYLVVLETTRQRLDAQLREADMMANIRRARAQLDHGVGGKSLDIH